MDLNELLASVQDCPCGREHRFALKHLAIESGLTARCGEMLRTWGFPERLLLVADRNTLRASEGILGALDEAGFSVKQLIYENLLYARSEGVEEVEALCADVEGILSVVAGSLKNKCRVAAYRKGKRLCIFATAPSMDGFASDTAPIIKDSFKTSWQAEQPEIILADTEILARAPAVLKSSGFGDMVAKYIGLVDWKVAHLLIGEYYCDRIAAMTKDAVERIVALADRITEEDEEVAGAVMEALVLTGLAMKLAGCSRPASGAEHVISHYWECHKILRGIWPDFHGRKVGVATVLCFRIYHALSHLISFQHVKADPTDFDDVYAHYDPAMHNGVREMNNPTITDEIDPVHMQNSLLQISKIIRDTLPPTSQVEAWMKAAGAVTECEDVHVDRAFLEDGLRYHAYMRHRLLITRILPMLGQDAVSLLDNADAICAHEACSNHRAALEKDNVCGCFHCRRIFSPTEITDWLKDTAGTARCPYCGIDSVIGESSGYPITKEFLSSMHDVWF